MSKDDQIDFVIELSKSIVQGIVRDINAGKVPEEWDGIELRWLLHDRSDTMFGTPSKRRRLDYKNTRIVNNL